MTTGPGGGGGSAVDAVQVDFHYNLIDAQVTVPTKPNCGAHTVDLVEIGGQTVMSVGVSVLPIEVVVSFDVTSPRIRKSGTVNYSCEANRMKPIIQRLESLVFQPHRLKLWA
uniref:Uncharacterized protein n=1 Tax=Schistocephalus solidus TaxID=70667 RepID=A0A0X3PGA1_SCHSO